jgi:cytochrome P450
MIEESPALLPQQSRLEMIKDVAGVAYIAGSDTTVAAVISFFLAMLIHPNVQTKAQAEVDRIVGKDRLPELEDRKELPYTEGVVNECLRWLPVLPMGECSALRSLVAAEAETEGRCSPSGNGGR